MQLNWMHTDDSDVISDTTIVKLCKVDEYNIVSLPFYSGIFWIQVARKTEIETSLIIFL